MKLPVNVLFMAAEADPFIKVGGLGDVAGSLSEALFKPIHDQNRHLNSVAKFNIDHTQGKIPVKVFEIHLNGLIVNLVASDLISNDEEIYHPDAGQDGPKYTLFSWKSSTSKYFDLYLSLITYYHRKKLQKVEP